MKSEKGISRREFLRGAGAIAAGVAAMSVFGGCAAAAPEESAAVPAAAVKSEARHSVLAFASDQHAETPGFDKWLGDQLAVHGDALTHLSYGGDICDKAWVQDTFDGFKAVLDARLPGRYAVTTGNQEFKAGAPGPAWETLGHGFVRLGEAARTEDYIVYHLGAAQEGMEFPPADVEALGRYLDAAPDNIPIFVVSHYPLHLSVPYAYHDIPGGYRQTKGNDALCEVMNRHPNVIFLWGHNHTFQDPRYGTVRPAGSSFTYDINDVTKKLTTNFVYANLGSFCRGDTYGAMAEVDRDGDTVTVKLYYVDTDVPMDNKESAVITYAADGTVSADITPSDDINFLDMYYLAGWYDDPNFEAEY